MYIFSTPYGDLQYKKANMMDVDIAVARWKSKNSKPKIPMKPRKWGASETGRLITLSMRKYGKLPPFLTSEIREKLTEEITKDIPLEEKPNDADYLQAKEDYDNRVFQEHFKALLFSSIQENQDDLLLTVLSVESLRSELYQAIINVSTVTSEMVHNFILSMDRYYNGESFIEVMQRRTPKKDSSIPVESFRNVVNDLFIRYNVLGYAESLDIQQQALLAARLLTRSYIEFWSAEDARERAKGSSSPFRVGM